MLSYETIDTVDGPFTVVEDGGAVLASGWSADAREVLDRSTRRGEAVTAGVCASAAAARDFYAGDDGALAGVRIGSAGTAFRMRVWEALRAIPLGTVRTYGEVAASVGSPAASRAVGAACGANPIALFVPCHRVTGANGALTGFAWGLDVKRALLAREHGLVSGA